MLEQFAFEAFAVGHHKRVRPRRRDSLGTGERSHHNDLLDVRAVLSHVCSAVREAQTAFRVGIFDLHGEPGVHFENVIDGVAIAGHGIFGQTQYTRDLPADLRADSCNL